MPSSRWLLIAVIAVYSTQWIKSVIAAELSDPLPVASNGWRPIVGSSQVKPPPFDQKQKQTISLTSNDSENRNKNEKHKAQNNQNNKGGGGNQVHINHHGSTGHHQKLHPPPSTKQQYHKQTGHSTVLVTGKPALRHPVMNKLHAHMALSAKRHKPSKPPQVSSRPHTLRDEIMAPAPSSAIGSYAYYNQGPLSLQNSQLGGKPFHSPGHIDFSNHFAFSNVNNDIVLPQSHFNFGKHQNQNDLQGNQFVFVNQNDEFTRNLVPPPPVYKPQGEKETIPKEPTKIIDQSATISTPQFVFGGQKDLPENLILQLPPPYKFQQNIQQQHQNNPTFDLEITKEKFKEFHTTLAPTSFKTSTESFLDVTKFTKPKDFVKTSLHGYEVTEEKEWNDPIIGFKHYSTVTPKQPSGHQQPFNYQQNAPDSKFHYIQQQIHLPEREEQPNLPQFLPTPYSPNGPSPNIEHAFPTSPTQAEISTIYSDIAQMNKKKPYLKYPEPTNYNIKEVATHFPFFEERPQEQPNNHQQFIKETTTKKTLELEETDGTPPYVKPTQQTTLPIRGSTRRPGQRRRRPTRPTTEAIELNTDEVYETYSERTTEKPQRRRRPIKYRTTESPKEETESTTRSTFSYRPKPTRPQVQTITEEQFLSSKPHRYKPSKVNYQVVNDDAPEETTRHYIKFNRPRDETKYRKEVFTEETLNTQPETIQDIFGTENIEPTTETIRNIYRYQEEQPTEQRIKKRKRIRPVPPQTTELSANTNLNIPENELDYTTLPSNDEQSEETVTVREFYDFETEKETTTILTTSPSTTTPTTTTRTTTTTTTEPTTTKSNRARRPIKYDSQRPRFSVKDYRQRLNQYMSTTTDSTKSVPETTVSSPRIRYPNRFKIPTTANAADVEETTDQLRQKFVPKDPRHRQYGHHTTETPTEVTTEKKLSHRVRPFGRYRSTTENTPSSTSTTQRVSIKPNIFNNLKRPQHLSLRNRIYNKRNSTTTTEQNTELPEIEDIHTEKTEVTIPYESAESKIEVTTQIYEVRKEPNYDVTTRKEILPTEITKLKISEIEGDLDDVSIDDDEAFMQLQRISDLTSSAHKQYNTPGMFKSVSPTSRRVPNYFTIATEDPILPIEAFFPNLNHKN